MALDGGPVHDLAMGIDDADRGLLHGDIEADVVLLAHGGAPGLDRSAIMPPLPLREAPRIPHLSPARRRACVEHIIDVLHVSERRACRALGQHRSTQRKVPRGRDDEEALTADLVALAERYGRYGYRKISALLKAAGWLVNDKRVERIWRREGLKVPTKQPKRGRIWDNDGSCLRLRPEYRNHGQNERNAPL
uniref:HTH-like domain-containing protein n=1 Tax=Pseudomonas sp. K-62 TaxID=76885 RepID=I2FG05_9PSED|nr:hypothetical protein [Pseudomonas sp. K-62]